MAVPVLALTPNRETACRLALVWGVHAVVTKDAHDVDDMAKRACKLAGREGFAKARSHHYRCRRSVWHARRDQHDPDRRARWQFEVAGQGSVGASMASPLPKSLLDVSSLTESKMSHGRSEPPPLGLARHQHLTFDPMFLFYE